MRRLRHPCDEDVFTQIDGTVGSKEQIYSETDFCTNVSNLISYSDDSSDYDDDPDFSMENVCIDASFEIQSRGDPRNASIYMNEMEIILQNEESEQLIPFGKIERLQGLKIKEIRMMLIDWLVNLSFVYPSTTETIYQCISLLDRYLAREEIKQNNLQLIGCCCMWICSKIEFHTSASLDPLIRCCHEKFSKNDFIKIESHILNIVDYKMHTVTSNSFLRWFLTIINAPDKVSLLASYLCECSLLTLGMSYFRPSLVAFCSVAVACLSFKASDSISIITNLTKFEWKDAAKCLALLLKTAHLVMKLEKNGIYRKFSHKKLNGVEYAGANIIQNAELGFDLVQTLAQFFNQEA